MHWEFTRFESQPNTCKGKPLKPANGPSTLKTKPTRHREYAVRTRGAALDLALDDRQRPWPGAPLDFLAHEVASRPRPWAVDLFSGAGGLSLGIEEAGFSVVAAADSDSDSIETHTHNIPCLTWTGDLADPSGFISQLDSWGIDTVDLLAGGPPCQPFSRAGTSKIGNLIRSGLRQAIDSRADLWQSFFAIADRLRPRAVLFENVPDFAEAQGGALLIALVDELRSRGYAVHVDGGAERMEIQDSSA